MGFTVLYRDTREAIGFTVTRGCTRGVKDSTVRGRSCRRAIGSTRLTEIYGFRTIVMWVISSNAGIRVALRRAKGSTGVGTVINIT